MLLQDMTKYIRNGGSYENLFKDELGFTTRIYGGYFREKGLELQNKLSINDKLILRKEPENKYDKNAIAIYNIANNHLGYLLKELALKLANTEVEEFIPIVVTPYSENDEGEANLLGTKIALINKNNYGARI